MMAVPPLFFAVSRLFAVFAATIASLESCHYREAVSAGLKIPYP
jgi:hypothetical protein